MYNTVNTDVICPNCGEGHMIREEPKVIKSNTETYAYLCPCCGFVHTAKSDEDMKEWIKSLDKPVCYTEAPQKCLNEHCEHAEVFKDKLMCTHHNKWFDLTPVEKGETDYHAKQDYGKSKLTLVPRRIIWDVAAIREYGNNKYPDGGPDNWRGVEPERYRDAAYRHFLRYLDDPKSVDSESGLPHLWHLACNIAFLCEMEDRYLSKDPEVVERLKKVFRGYQPPSEEGEEYKDERGVNQIVNEELNNE